MAELATPMARGIPTTTEQQFILDLKNGDYGALQKLLSLPNDRGLEALRGFLTVRENRRLIVEMAKDEPAMKNALLDIARGPESSRRLIKGLKSDQFVNTVVDMSNDGGSLRTMLSFFGTSEGGKFGSELLGSPKGWVFTLKLLNAAGKSGEDYYNELEESGKVKKTSRIKVGITNKELTAIFNKGGEEAIELFKEFSQSDAKAKVCADFLKDKGCRTAMFSFILSCPEDVTAAFRELFREKGRIRRIADIFRSDGGTELLVELARDRTGRRIMFFELGSEPGTKAVGLFVIGEGPGTPPSSKFLDKLAVAAHLVPAYKIFQGLCEGAKAEAAGH